MCVVLLPGHADVADTVSKVAVTCKALLYGPLRFLTTTLCPGRQWTSSTCRVPPAGWFSCFAGLYHLKTEHYKDDIKNTVTAVR